LGVKVDATGVSIWCGDMVTLIFVSFSYFSANPITFLALKRMTKLSPYAKLYGAPCNYFI